MNAEDLKSRTKQFALRCIRLAESLPRGMASRTICSQLIDCSTSVAANYRAACRARSRAEFIAKLGIVEEEVDESAFWMEMIVARSLKAERLVKPLHEEADALTRIVAASIKSARQRHGRNPKSTIRNPQ
jgi:four helix bundle protein